MKEPIGWDELRLFLAVARSGGLAGAARLTAVSAPTLGRRITQLERRLDRKLFDRKQTGYSLTRDGHDLHRQVVEMESASAAVEQWRDRNARRMVRISVRTVIDRLVALLNEHRALFEGGLPRPG